MPPEVAPPHHRRASCSRPSGRSSRATSRSASVAPTAVLRHDTSRACRSRRASTSRAACTSRSRSTTPSRRRRRTRARRSTARSRSCARASRASASPSRSSRRQGNDRIVVELPGIDDRERAHQDRAGSGLPRVPDHRQDAGAREGASAARRDREAARWLGRRRRCRRDGRRARATAAERPAHDGRRHVAKSATRRRRRDSAKKDTATCRLADARAGGAFSKLILGRADARRVLRRDEQAPSARSVPRVDSAVMAALPPGKVLRFGTDSTVARQQGLSRALPVDAQADHHR